MSNIPNDKDTAEYILVLRKKPKPPVHLKKWQDKMRQVAPICSKETEGLKGEERVRAFNACISRLIKEGTGMRKRYIIISKDDPISQEMREKFEQNGFEYVDLMSGKVRDILSKVKESDFDNMTIPMAVECDKSKCKLCRIEITDSGIEFNC